MLDIDLVDHADVEAAARTFHRDGFVVLRAALSPAQLERSRAGAARVIAEQTAAIAPGDANRGFARYSFGSQIHHPEWAALVDLPTVLPLIDRIWGGTGYRCVGGGGDYALPGADVQGLHSDIGEFLHDPLGRVTVQDLPTPFIVVNFPLIDFTAENGATRFVPGTHRSRQPIPSLAEEPAWMRSLQIAAPAGCALVRDVRCWHGGMPNRSRGIRPMTSVGYYAPWFAGKLEGYTMPRERFDGLSPRGRELCRGLLQEEPPAGADRASGRAGRADG